MGKETSKRIQTSLLNSAEKKALVWLAGKQPGWVTSDMLTYIGVLGAFICAVGFWLANENIYYLWLSSFGLVVNWYGDSLDGTLARVRNAQRPIYGFFIDHSLDAITICLMCGGAAISPMFKFNIPMFVLVGYLVLSIYTYILTIIRGEFLLTYSNMGPTELRLFVILINTIYMYTSVSEIGWDINGEWFSLYDLIGIAVICFLAFAWLKQFLKDRKLFSEQDPIKTRE